MSDTETMRIERFDLPPLQQPNGKPIDQWGLRDNRCSRHHGLCRTIRLLGSARRDDPELSALFEVRINGLPHTAEISDVVMSRVDSLCDLVSVCAQAVYFCRSLSSN